MAEAIGLAASLLGIAGVGVSIVSTLAKFHDLYCDYDERIDRLSAKVSVTASILTQLGTVVQQYEKEFHLVDDNFQKVRETCDRDFETLRAALRMVRPDNNAESDASTFKPVRGFTTSKNPRFLAWNKLKWTLGGAEQVETMIVSLESSKSNLQLLLESTNLFILRKLDRRQSLTPEMAEDLKELMKHVPALIVALERANLIPHLIDMTRKESELEGEIHAQIDPSTQEEVDLEKRIEEIERPEEMRQGAETVGIRTPQRVRHLGERSPDGRYSAPRSITPDIADPIIVQVDTAYFGKYVGWIVQWIPGEEVTRTISVLCGISFLKQESKGGYYGAFPYECSQKKLKTFVDSFDGLEEDSLDALSGMPARARMPAYRILSDQNAENEAYYRDRNLRYDKGDGEEWVFAAMVPIFNKYLPLRGNAFRKSARRDSNTDQSWLLILKQKPRIMKSRSPVRSRSGRGYYRERDRYLALAGRERERPLPTWARTPQPIIINNIPHDEDYIDEPDVSLDLPQHMRDRGDFHSKSSRPAQRTMSQEAAEKIMEAFLATFTSMDDHDARDDGVVMDTAVEDDRDINKL